MYSTLYFRDESFGSIFISGTIWKNCSTVLLRLRHFQSHAPDDMLQQLMMRFEPKTFYKTRCKIYIQVLVDSNGTATLLSTDNRTNVKSKNLICNTPSTVLNGHLPTTKKYNLYNWYNFFGRPYGNNTYGTNKYHSYRCSTITNE